MVTNFPEFNNKPFVVITGVRNVTQFFQIVGKRGYRWGTEYAHNFTQDSLSQDMINMQDNLAFIIESEYLAWDRRQYFEESYDVPIYTFQEFLEKIEQYKQESAGLDANQIAQFSALM